MPRLSLTARRHWAAWLLIALLWAQGLGVWHHTVHTPGLKSLRIAAEAEARGPVYSSPLHHTANSADCRLLDQLLLADGVAAVPLALRVLPAEAAAALGAPVTQAALAALRPYLARAPPGRG